MTVATGTAVLRSTAMLLGRRDEITPRDLAGRGSGGRVFRATCPFIQNARSAGAHDADRIHAGAPRASAGDDGKDRRDEANLRRRDARWLDPGARRPDSLRDGRREGFFRARAA